MSVAHIHCNRWYKARAEGRGAEQEQSEEVRRRLTASALAVVLAYSRV